MEKNEAALEGARWWNESLERLSQEQRKNRPASDVRRKFIVGALQLGGVVLLVSWFRQCASDDDDEGFSTVDYDTLDLQKKQGWNVGEPSRLLEFPAHTSVDVDGATLARGNFPPLATLLAPTTPQYEPFFVPTLFASLTDPRARSLREQMVAENPLSARLAYDQATAIADLFTRSEAPTTTAVILDLPGPDTVAVAAALSAVLDPIFCFDNWPHPQGWSRRTG